MSCKATSFQLRSNQRRLAELSYVFFPARLQRTDVTFLMLLSRKTSLTSDGGRRRCAEDGDDGGGGGDSIVWQNELPMELLAKLSTCSWQHGAANHHPKAFATERSSIPIVSKKTSSSSSLCSCCTFTSPSTSFPACLACLILISCFFSCFFSCFSLLSFLS